MDVILLKKIENLGAMGDRVSVKPGYGRNFLIPQGKAAPATAEKVAEFEARRAELENAAAETLVAAEARRDQLDGMTLTLQANAGEEGKLFGSIGTAEIAHAIQEAGVSVEKQEVRLPMGAYRQTGEYEVPLHLHTDVNVTVKLVIEAE
ncbi:MAG: 50S ribosomal protein L9 [Thiohalobacterales bacterium]